MIMRDNCVQVVQKLPVIYYYIIIPTNYNLYTNKNSRKPAIFVYLCMHFPI